jgi:MFS family permease
MARQHAEDAAPRPEDGDQSRLDRTREVLVEQGWKERAGRMGLTARGVLFLLLGVMVIRIAVGESDEGDAPADTPGALNELADRPGGLALLLAVVVGLALNALWRFVQALTIDEDTPAKAWVRRARSVATGAVYGGLAVIGAVIAFQDVESDGEAQAGGEGGEQAQTVTAEVLQWPGGRLLVGAVGIGIVVAALWHTKQAFTLGFERRLDMDEVSDAQRPFVRAVGVAGMLGRFGAFAAIGWFVVQAALQFDPDEPLGLDQALHEVAAEPWGTWMVGAVGAGLLCWGLFGLAEARWRPIPLEE